MVSEALSVVHEMVCFNRTPMPRPSSCREGCLLYQASSWDTGAAAFHFLKVPGEMRREGQLGVILF